MKRLLAVAALFAAPFAAAGEPPTVPAVPGQYSPKISAASDAGEQAIKGFKLQPGLKAELWVAEPLAANPVAFAFDGQGRLYLVETFRHGLGVDTGSIGLNVDQDLALRTVDERVEFMKKRWGKDVEKFTKDHDRVRLVEDTDGDGKADKATPFAERFNGIPDGLGAGVMEYKGDVYYTCIPNVWKLRDTNGDGKADVFDILSTGYGVHGGFLGHDLHGLRMGPDGKVYYTIGDRGASVKFGDKLFDYPDCGTCWRCNPDGSELEVFAYGLRNPQELAFDEFGNIFTGENNSDGGDKARFVYILEGSDTGWRQGYQYLTTRGPWNQEKLWYPWFKGQAAYLLPPIANYANGPSGITYNPGATTLGNEWKGHFFLTNFSGGPKNSGIFALSLKPKGAGFEIGNSKQLIWDILATDCEIAPDGSLFVSDWTTGWNKPNKGRIYRISDPTKKGDGLAAEVKKLLAEDFSKRKPADLLGYLSHADQRIRLNAQFALADRGVEARPFFEQALKAENLLGRLHGIWGLGQLGRKTPEALQPLVALLGDKDPEVRAQATRVLGDAKVAAAFPGIVALLKDESARVKMFAAMALGKIGNPAAVEPLAEMMRGMPEDDPWLRHGAVMGFAWLNAPDAVLAKAGDASPKVRMAVLLALRRWKNKEIARFLADADPAIVLEAARAINDEPIPDAMPALAALLKPAEPAAESAGPEMKLKVDYWLKFNGDLGSLAKNPNFPAKPDRSTNITSFEMPMNTGDGYAARIHGVITAPKEGAYTFFVTADDMAELWLSTDENPANKKKIATCPDWAPSRTWDKYPEQKSAPVTLKAGAKYFAEVIYKEGKGDDQCSVGWQLPDGSLERPIGGEKGTDEDKLRVRRVINAAFRQGGATNAQALATQVMNRASAAPLRVEALNCLADWAKPFPRDRVLNLFRPLPDRDPAPAVEALKPIIDGLITKGSSEIQIAAAKAAENLKIAAAGDALLSLALDPAGNADARVQALKALSALNDKGLLKAVNAAMNDKNLKVRQEGSAQMAKLNPDEAITSLANVLKTGSVEDKQGVLPILARMKKPAADTILTEWLQNLNAGKVQPELQLDVWEAGKQSENKAIKDLASKYESSFNVHDEFDVYKVALVGGDVDEGRRVFQEHNAAQCLRCHKLNNEGGDVGPELKGVATRNPREYLLEAIVNPSAKIAQGFEQIVVVTNEGKIVTGIAKGETEKDLSVMLADGKTEKINKSDIKTRRNNKSSAMPPMGEVLTKMEIRNLVEYLSTLK